MDSPSLHTHRNGGRGSWHQKRKEDVFLTVSQKWVILPFQVEKFLLTGLKPKQNTPQSGYIHLQNSMQLCWDVHTTLYQKWAQECIQCDAGANYKNNCHWCKTNPSSVSSPTKQNLRWKRHLQVISKTTLPRPIWSCEEKEVQWSELTHGMTIHNVKWPPYSQLRTGSLQQSSQGVKQHLLSLVLERKWFLWVFVKGTLIEKLKNLSPITDWPTKKIKIIKKDRKFGS